MKRIGIEEIVPVCRLVEASEKDNPLCKFEGQTVKMDEVNFFAKRLYCIPMSLTTVWERCRI